MRTQIMSPVAKMKISHDAADGLGGGGTLGSSGGKANESGCSWVSHSSSRKAMAIRLTGKFGAVVRPCL